MSGCVVRSRRPRRPAGIPADLVQPPDDIAWTDLKQGSGFPGEHYPADGVVASANDEPPSGEVPAGYFVSPPDRVQRPHAMLVGDGKLDLEDLARTQTDV